MNFGQLLARARTRLDDGATPYLWSDNFILDAYNEAIDEACLRTRGILESQNSKLCVIPVIAGQQRYTLDSTIIRIGRVRLDNCPTPLEFTTIGWLDKHVEYWDSAQQPDQPWCYFTDQDRSTQLTIGLVPVPATNDVMRLSVWRMPLACEYLTTQASSVPPLPPFMHRGLVDWVEHLAFGNDDTDTKNVERSVAAEARFTARYGERPTGHDLKLMAVNAMRGTRPCFF